MSTANPSSGRRQPAGSGSTQPAGARTVESSRYALMKQYRRRANEYLARALEIDEKGKGNVLLHIYQGMSVSPPFYSGMLFAYCAWLSLIN